MSIIEQIILIYVVCQVLIGGPILTIGFYIDLGYVIFNPKQLYERTRLNLFGAWCIAIFTWIVFTPWAIGYWIYKIFTVGG